MKYQYVFYKANPKITGSALSIEYNSEKKCGFFEFAKQKEEKKFDWENKITLKLSTGELSKILAFYREKKEELSLFHDPAKGQYVSDTKNTILKLNKSSFGYSFRVNQQEKDNTVNSISINLTDDEMCIMEIFCTNAIEKIIFDITQ